MKKFKKGFTLIELLVVIAIIGILATIVIINIASARGKAVNAHVLADLNTADKTAVMCMDEGNYLMAKVFGGSMVQSTWGYYLTTPWPFSFTTDKMGGYPICSSNSGYTSTAASDYWPNISTYGKSPNGASWDYQRTSSYGNNTLVTYNTPSFVFVTGTNFVSSDDGYQAVCTEKGCTASNF